MIKNVIFDWSGVIGDDLLTIYKANMVMFRKLGAPEISLEEFTREWEQPYMRFYKRYGMFVDGQDEKNMEEEKAIFRAAYNALLAQYPVKPFPHIKEALQKLQKAGVKMIILSSNLKETLQSDIEGFGLQGIFGEVNHEVHDKAEDIAEIIQRNGFKPAETIFVGDTPHEVEAGKSAGTKTAAVLWGFSSEEKLKAANPDFLVHNPEELASIILK